MAAGFPCPNPACEHVFAPEVVKRATTLVCPLCAARFQFRAATAPPPSVPVADPVEEVPPRHAIPAAVPIARPVEIASNPFSLTTAAVTLAPPRPKRGRRLTWSRVGVIMVLGAAVAGGAAGVLWLLQHARTDEKGSEDSHASMLNYRFVYPRGWKLDGKIRKALGANLAMARAEPSAGLALFAHDYKTRSPRDAELHDQAVTWLDKYFRGLEFEAKPNAKLDGLPARRFEFQGEVDHVLVTGECLMLARRGYGYWLVTWASAERRDVAAEEWPAVRNGFHFLDNREGWAEKKPRQVQIQGAKAAYRLAYTEGVWERQPLDGFDPSADMLLRGFDPRDDDKLADRAGIVTVLNLPRGEGDLKAGAAAAREHLLGKQREVYPETSIELVADKNGPAEGPADIGAARGHLARLRVKNSASREMYVELATILLADGVLVIQGECLWPRREFWRQEFAPLRETLRLRKGK